MISLEPVLDNKANTAGKAKIGSDKRETNTAMIHRSVTEDQICILSFDRIGAQANLFDRATLEQLNGHLNAIATSPHFRGLVLISAKPSIFIAGADIHAMSGSATTEEIKHIIELGQRVFNRLANLPLPKVAAIHGACVGGGYEVCLSCDYRIATKSKCTKIGLPETKLGILPGWGGTTRLPRLIGLPAALDIILGGKVLSAKAALKGGLIDEVTNRENLLESAIKILNKKGQKLLVRRLPRAVALINNKPVASIIRRKLKGTLLKKTRGHYPALLKALEVATKGISQSIAGSLFLERQAILELSQTEECRNLIRIFFLQERAKKFGTKAAEASQKTEQIAVVGAGIMGSGIAQWSSSRSIQVILRDVNTEQVAKGMAAITKLYRQGLTRRIFTPTEAQSGIDRIYPAPREVPLKNSDIIIEAAVEKMDVKKTIFKRLAELSGARTILATNTSALSISELAESVPNPERVIGIHFFNPVHRMPLVEIVMGKKTSEEVLQRSLHFTHQIGKLPVIVKDSPGFLVNRVLMPYLVEAGNLFEQGADSDAIDKAMLDFGMPMGPLRLIDEVGVDVAGHVAQTLGTHFPERFTIPNILTEMIQAKMLGRKVGAGFFLHAKGQKHEITNKEVYRFVRGDSQAKTTIEHLQKRMIFLMVNEAARCLEEGVVGTPDDVDFGMIMGTGFAPFRGGPLRYADTYGIAKIVNEMEQIAVRGHEQFIPADTLQSMATTNKTFYQDNG